MPWRGHLYRTLLAPRDVEIPIRSGDSYPSIRTRVTYAAEFDPVSEVYTTFVKIFVAGSEHEAVLLREHFRFQHGILYDSLVEHRDELGGEPVGVVRPTVTTPEERPSSRATTPLGRPPVGHLHDAELSELVVHHVLPGNVVMVSMPFLAASSWGDAALTLNALGAIAASLDVMHRHQAVHGDVKLENARYDPHMSRLILVDTDAMSSIDPHAPYYSMRLTPEFSHPDVDSARLPDPAMLVANDRWGFVSLVAAVLFGEHIGTQLGKARGGRSLSTVDLPGLFDQPLLRMKVSGTRGLRPFEDIKGLFLAALGHRGRALVPDPALPEWSCARFLGSLRATKRDTTPEPLPSGISTATREMLRTVQDEPVQTRATKADIWLQNHARKVFTRWALGAFVATMFLGALLAAAVHGVGR